MTPNLIDQGRVSDFDIDCMIRQADTTPFPSLLASALNELKTRRSRDAELRALAEKLEREADSKKHTSRMDHAIRAAEQKSLAAEIRKIMGER